MLPSFCLAGSLSFKNLREVCPYCAKVCGTIRQSLKEVFMENSDFISEVETLVVQKEDKKPTVRLTPAQQRNEKTALMIEAIENRSLEDLKKANDLYPKADLSNSLKDFAKALYKTFSKDIADYLKDHLKVKYYVNHYNYQKNLSVEALEYLIDTGVGLPAPFCQKTYDHYTNYVQDQAEKYKAMSARNYSDEVFALYTCIISDFDAEDNARTRAHRQNLLDLLDRKYPDFLNILLDDQHRASDFMMRGFNKPNSLNKILQKGQVKWDELFKYWKTHSRFQYITPKQFLGMMKTFQSQGALDQWRNFVEEFKEDKKVYDQIVSEYFSKKTYTASKMYSLLEKANFKQRPYHQKGTVLQMVENQIQNTIQHQSWMKQHRHLHEKDEKTLDQIFLETVCNLQENIDIPNAPFDLKLLKKDRLLSPYERMFSQNTEMCKILSQTSYGQKILRNIVNDKSYSFHQSLINDFLSNTEINTFRSVFKAIPELATYRDDEGNNVFHLYVIRRKDTAKTVAEALLRTSMDLFSAPNDSGKNVLDLMIDNGMEGSSQAYIEKMLLKKNLNNDEEAGAKLRSRTKFSAPKRRM